MGFFNIVVGFVSCLMSCGLGIVFGIFEVCKFDGIVGFFNFFIYWLEFVVKGNYYWCVLVFWILDL